MPFKMAPPEKCPKCGKSVYKAEEMIGAGKHWHKSCFVCGLCKKNLDSNNMSEHDNEVFCTNCHKKKFGIKGYGHGGGAGALSMDSGERLERERKQDEDVKEKMKEVEEERE